METERILKALKKLKATDKESAATFGDLADVLRVNPLDSLKVRKLKAGCNVAADAGQVIKFSCPEKHATRVYLV